MQNARLLYSENVILNYETNQLKSIVITIFVLSSVRPEIVIIKEI